VDRRLVLSGAAAVGLSAWPARTRAESHHLRFGLTAVILADQAAFLARWAAYLSRQLDAKVTFVTRDEYQALHDLLASGQIDVLWTCGYPFVRFQTQLSLVAVPIYQGQPTYQSYLIRPRGDESVKRWADLRDKVFAYSDPLSNSGWLVAQGQLAAVGLKHSDLKRAFFAHGHRNVAEAIAARLAHAGSIDGYVWETMRLQGMPAAQQTEVIWKSPFHAFPPVVAANGSRHAKVEQLQRVLLAMGSHEAGRELLRALNLDGFEAGNPGLFESIRRLALSVPGSGVRS
jgi:phosphonate transport system substrate-binding protein